MLSVFFAGINPCKVGFISLNVIIAFGVCAVGNEQGGHIVDQATSDRFNRLETKIDMQLERLADIVRVQTTVDTQQHAIQELFMQHKELSARVSGIETLNAQVIGGQKALRWIGSGLIALASLLIGYTAAQKAPPPSPPIIHQPTYQTQSQPKGGQDDFLAERE